MSFVALAAPAGNGTFSLTAVLIGLLLLAGNGMFVAAEISLLATRRARIEDAAEAGDRRAARALEALRELSVTFSGAQLGITMCSLGLGAVVEPAIAGVLLDLLSGTALPAGMVPVLSVTLALGLVVFLHMVVGEMAPKNLAVARPEQVALRLVRPFGWFVRVLRPLIVGLNGLTNLLVRAVRVQPVDEHQLVHTPDELAFVLAESRQVGTISPQDASVMGAALRLAAIDAAAAMTPRVDLEALPDTAVVGDVIEVAAGTGHTRIPVYHEDIDHVVGLVHVKDVLIQADHDHQLPVTAVMRPLRMVPGSRDLERLLRDMLDERNHAVLVVDEFGGTAGLITLEDVLEELVGEISDEFDAEQHARRSAEHLWVVPGTLRRDEVARLTGLELHGGEAETVSGWLVERLGRLLDRGDRVRTADGWELTVLSLEGRRAGEVEVRAPQAVPGAAQGDGGRAR